MAIRTPDEIDFSTFPESDGQPMAETYVNGLQMFDLLWNLWVLFDAQGRGESTTVGANQFVYYNRLNGRDNISPDVYVIFDHAPPAPPSWKTWIEGKFPDIVFEITSPSTQAQDLSTARGGKRELYARLGAREYYVYDPQQELRPPFQGFEIQGERLEPLPKLASGGIISPLLGTELRPLPLGMIVQRPAGTWLRVIDPRTGNPIPLLDEELRDHDVTRARLLAEERARLLAEQHAADQERARLLAEQARTLADERAARAEAELQALRAELARRQGAGPTS